MIDKVYLLWASYLTKEMLLIGTLVRDNSKYVFKYEKDVSKAIDLGCMIPFPYTDELIRFDSLPLFFYRRMIRRELLDQFNVNYNRNDELSILTSTNGKRNNDNFYVVRFEVLEKLKNKEKVRL